MFRDGVGRQLQWLGMGFLSDAEFVYGACCDVSLVDASVPASPTMKPYSSSANDPNLYPMLTYPIIPIHRTLLYR